MAFLNNEAKTSNKNLPHWYTPHDGIHHSTHRPIPLPSNDVVSHLFSAIVSPSSPVLIDAVSGAATSYADLRRRVESLSAALRSRHGLSKGDVVLCVLPNSVDYPIVLLSVLFSGAVVSAMNPLSSAAEIARQVGDSRPKLAFAAPERAGELRRLGLACVVVEADPKSEFSAMNKFSGEMLDTPTIEPDDTAAIMYSSGTTGASKGVVLTHRNLVAMIELFVRFEASQYEQISGSESVYLAVLPMFHIYGMSLFAIGVLSLGAAVVVLRRFDAGEVAAAVERFGVTHFPVVPPIMTAISRLPVAERRRMRSLRQLSSGASPLSGKAIQDFVEAFPHVDFIQVKQKKKNQT